MLRIPMKKVLRLWQAEEFRFSRQLIASALVLFFLLTVFCSFPFIADDYRFLAESYGPGFSLTSFNPFVERMPVSMLLNYVLFKFHVWEKTWAVLYVFFIAHVMGFALVFKWLQGRIRTESAAESRTPLPATATFSWPFLAFAVLLTLNPNFYEVFYWPSAAPYMFGYLILAGALYARSGLVKSILFATTLFVSEMFGPVLFCLLLAPYLLTGQPVRKFSVAYLKSTLPWWAGILLYGLIRVTLMQFLPAREYHVAFTLHNLAGQFMFYLRMLFEIQFIRLNWVSSILELLGLSVLLFAIKKERPCTLRTVGIAFLLVSVSSLPNFLLIYDAPRAYFATILFWSLLLLVLAQDFFTVSALLKTKRFVLILFGLSYLIGNCVVVVTKNRNFNVLRSEEAELVQKLRSCESPCTLSIAHLGDRLRGDWTLDPLFYAYYAEWVRLRYKIEKDVTYLNHD